MGEGPHGDRGLDHQAIEAHAMVVHCGEKGVISFFLNLRKRREGERESERRKREREGESRIEAKKEEKRRGAKKKKKKKKKRVGEKKDERERGECVGGE